MMDKIHKYIVTAAAVLIIVWVVFQASLFVYNLTAAVNNLGVRVTNIERALTAPQPVQPTN